MADSVPLTQGGTFHIRNQKPAGRYRPGVQDTGWWVGREAARTPQRFRERVIAQFRDPQNVRYLWVLFAKRLPRGPLRDFTLATLHDAVLSYSEGDGRIYDVLDSDPVAQRGEDRAAVGLWGEIRRLNRAFYEDRLAFLREQAHNIERRAPRDGVSEDDEQYHMRMFISDSLRPPGLEHLNTPGPLYALREDQSTWIPRSARGSGRGTWPPYGGREGFSGAREGFEGHPAAGGPCHGYPGVGRPAAGQASPGLPDADVYLYGEDDAPWGVGDPNRTPEQAMSEYWGDGWTTSETMTGAPERMGKAYGSLYAWGNAWEENGGTRFMRRETIPFWQMGGREGYDYDIEENLGTAGRELDGQVRRWDMDRLRHPRGQEYRRFGPRSGHVV